MIDTTGNIGTASASPSTTRYYLSVDNVITGSDLLLTGARPIPGLTAFESSSGTTTVTIPTNLAPGTYFLGACADDLATVTESNEANNCSVSTATVTISAPPNITNITPSSGPIGTFVVIHGSNFGVVQGTTLISFNGVLAIPTGWSDTEISTTVPTGATTGPLTLTREGVSSNSVPFTVNPSHTLLTAYGFEEGSGSTANDASGNGNNGTIVAATWTNQGKFGNALVFDGVSSRVTAGNLTLSGPFTLMAWVLNPSNDFFDETIIKMGLLRIEWVKMG